MSSIYRQAIALARRLGSHEVQTHEGGIAFGSDQWSRLDRFLILGSEGTYYATGSELTIESLGIVRACLDEDGRRTVATIAAISESGRAPKQEPALLALACAAAHRDPDTRKAALAALPRVCRTGTHLLHFAAYVDAQRGWGRGLRRAVGSWFTSKDANALAYQAIKYQARDGWTLADLLCLSHPKANDPAANAVLKWVVDAELTASAPTILAAREELHASPTTERAVELIVTHRLPREAVPTDLLNHRDIWAALLADMPMTAMIRNLAKMTTVGLLTTHSEATGRVVSALADRETLRRARVHPITILAALKVYEQGRGERGSLTWTPIKHIVNALDEAFYAAFGNVEASGKQIRLALDVSGSMDGSKVTGMPFLTAREASAAMALVTAAVEPNVEIVAYSHELVPVELRPSMRLDEVIRTLQAIPMGGTFCSLPIRDAHERGSKVDAFVSYTDSETWEGWHGYNQVSTQTASETLRAYRAHSGIPARHAVVAVASNGFTIADPTDPGQLDLVGFDTATPQVLSDFVAGRV
jgi:60 kDa SS-A/Ro ribonucleoprotein